MSPTTLFRRISCPGQGHFMAISCFPGSWQPWCPFRDRQPDVGRYSGSLRKTAGRFVQPPSGRRAVAHRQAGGWLVVRQGWRWKVETKG